MSIFWHYLTSMLLNHFEGNKAKKLRVSDPPNTTFPMLSLSCLWRQIWIGQLAILTITVVPVGTTHPQQQCWSIIFCWGSEAADLAVLGFMVVIGGGDHNWACIFISFNMLNLLCSCCVWVNYLPWNNMMWLSEIVDAMVDIAFLYNWDLFLM